MKVHKYANYFPLIEGEEFKMLVKDIKENGQNEPVVMFKGEILDGVNRTMACQELGIKPITKEYGGDDPLKYVISSNIRRRHLSQSQKAMLATEMLPEFEVLAKGGHGAGLDDIPAEPREKKKVYRERESAERVAKEFGVGGRSVQQAKRIKEEAPDRVDDIIKGKASVDAVDVELRAGHAAERATKKKEDATAKEVEANKQFVSEYFKAVKLFTDEIELAIVGAKRGKFDPAGINFVITKHEKIVESMRILEGLI